MKRPRKRLSSNEFSSIVVKTCVIIASLLCAYLVVTSNITQEKKVTITIGFIAVSLIFGIGLFFDYLNWRNSK